MLWVCPHDIPFATCNSSHEVSRLDSISDLGRTFGGGSICTNDNDVITNSDPPLFDPLDDDIASDDSAGDITLVLSSTVWWFVGIVAFRRSVGSDKL